MLAFFPILSISLIYVWILISLCEQVQVIAAPISTAKQAPSILAVDQAENYASIAKFAADA